MTIDWEESWSIPGVWIRSLTPRVDQRGHLMEILRSDDEGFKNFGQAYITTCRPGIVKAWHKHELQDDNMCVIAGMGMIGLWDEDTNETLSIFCGEMNYKLVHIPVGIWHGFTPINNEDIMVLNLPTRPYNRENPDEQRCEPFDELIPFDWLPRSG